MLPGKIRRGVVGILILFIFLLSLLHLVIISNASDPFLIEILDHLGFPNVNETYIENFPLGTYDLTFYAGFSEICNETEISCYEVNTTIFNAIFTSPENCSGYLDSPASKSFTAHFQFGLSVLLPDGDGDDRRCFTETLRNPDGKKHAKILENLDNPEMFLIGFRYTYETGNEKYNDLVLSLELREGLWDLDGDGKFDMRDIGIIVKAFGTQEGEPDWNPDADLTGPDGQPDGMVDIKDVALAAKYFGKKFPVAGFEYLPSCPVVDETVTFDASTSSDPDGSILNYRWDFGDGKVKTTNYPVTTHIYRKANSTVNYTVALTVTDDDCLTNSTSATIPVTNPAILHVSLPLGEDRTGIPDPDPWINECWLLNITDAHGTFKVRVDDVSNCIPSYDTHLTIALNDAAYNNLVNLTVNNITMVKNNFEYDILRPYDLRDWPSGDVYPTWHNDALINLGTICPKEHKNATVSVTFSSVTGAKIHLDAYGSKNPCPIPPAEKCYITYNPLSEDSTVLFQPQPACHLTITTSTGGTADPLPGNYTYDCGSSVLVYAIPDSCYLFSHWELDGSNVGSANPYSVLMNDDHHLHAVFVEVSYKLKITASIGGITDPPTGTYTYDCDSSASVAAIPDICYQFDHWELDGTDVGSANPYTLLMDDNHTLHAAFKYSPPPLSVSIDPPSASIFIGESVVFTSEVTGGTSPYAYQWYLNDNIVSEANENSWTFTPTMTGIYYIHLEVSDQCNLTNQSDTARISVITVPVGGRSVSINKPITHRQLSYHTALLALFVVVLSLICPYCRVRKKSHSKNCRTRSS